MYDSTLNVLIVCYLFLGGFGVFALYELITRPFKPKQTEEENRRLEALYAEQSDKLNRYRYGGGHKRKKEQEEENTKAKDALLKSSEEIIEEQKAEAKQRQRRCYLDIYTTVLLRAYTKLDDNLGKFGMRKEQVLGEFAYTGWPASFSNMLKQLTGKNFSPLTQDECLTKDNKSIDEEVKSIYLSGKYSEKDLKSLFYIGMNRLMIMVDASSFEIGHTDKDEQQICFRFEGCKKANYCHLLLTRDDTYTLRFLKLQFLEFKIVDKFEGIIAKDLRNHFENFTELSLGHTLTR